MHGQLILWTAKTHYSNHISIQTLSFALQAISQECRNNFIYITKHDVMLWKYCFDYHQPIWGCLFEVHQ